MEWNDGKVNDRDENGRELTAPAMNEAMKLNPLSLSLSLSAAREIC